MMLQVLRGIGFAKLELAFFLVNLTHVTGSQSALQWEAPSRRYGFDREQLLEHGTIMLVLHGAVLREAYDTLVERERKAQRHPLTVGEQRQRHVALERIDAHAAIVECSRRTCHTRSARVRGQQRAHGLACT